MSAPAIQRRRRGRKADQIHLPSVHVRNEDGSGHDYEEDLYVYTDHVERIIRFAMRREDVEVLLRETRDVLCADDWWAYQESLPRLMSGKTEAEAAMHSIAELELERQIRIAAGTERACLACGCSESRACSGGCIWATANLCSRCFL